MCIQDILPNHAIEKELKKCISMYLYFIKNDLLELAEHSVSSHIHSSFQFPFSIIIFVDCSYKIVVNKYYEIKSK